MIANFLTRNGFVYLFPGATSMYDKYTHKDLGLVQICYGTKDNPKIHLLIMQGKSNKFFDYVYELESYLWQRINE